MTIHRLTVDRAERRLDRYLAQALPDVSRSRLQQLIKRGAVTMDGEPAKATAAVAPGMTIEIDLAEPEEAAPLVAETLSLPVLYEDGDVLVIDKVAGMVVHPAPGHATGTVVNALLGAGLVVDPLEPERPGIVHRLDRDTSGVMIVAKTPGAQASLGAQFEARTTRKEYVALVEGHPGVQQGRIEAPLGRDPRSRQRMAVVPRGRDAVTEFAVTDVFPQQTLLLVHPLTGRTHQIRVHLASIAHPVTGDQLYGRASPLVGRQFLHAAALEIDLPSGRRARFEAPLPEDLVVALSTLRERRA